MLPDKKLDLESFPGSAFYVPLDNIRSRLSVIIGVFAKLPTIDADRHLHSRQSIKDSHVGRTVAWCEWCSSSITSVALGGIHELSSARVCNRNVNETMMCSRHTG